MNPRDEAVWKLAGWVAGLLDMRRTDDEWTDTDLLDRLATYYDQLGRPGDVLAKGGTR